MVAWQPDAEEPTRRAFEASQRDILAFVETSQEWVVEGCYADLLSVALPHATEIVFLNPGTATCIANARKRPWEPHKYASPEAQNANLVMLVDWIKAYDQRRDEFSYAAHRRLFDGFAGKKTELRCNVTR